MHPFLRVSIQFVLHVAMSETKEKREAFIINQENNLLMLYINHIVPSGLRPMLEILLRMHN